MWVGEVVPLNDVPSPKSQTTESITVPGGVVITGLKLVAFERQTDDALKVISGPGITYTCKVNELSQNVGDMAVNVTL